MVTLKMKKSHKAISKTMQKMEKQIAMHGGEAFQIANNSNFQMDVNGFRISVFFGPGASVDDANIHNWDVNAPMEAKYGIWGSNTAEVMIWDRNGDPIKWNNGETKLGSCTSDMVTQFIVVLAHEKDDDPTFILNAQYPQLRTLNG